MARQVIARTPGCVSLPLSVQAQCQTKCTRLDYARRPSVKITAIGCIVAVNLQQLQKEGIYEEKSSLASLLSDLDRISALAQEAAERKRRQGKTGLYVILAGLIGFAVGLVLPFLLPVACLAIFGGLVWWLYSLFSKGKLLDIPNVWRSPRNGSL